MCAFRGGVCCAEKKTDNNNLAEERRDCIATDKLATCEEEYLDVNDNVGKHVLMQGEEMSEYEKIRAANIKQKEEMLKTLQLKGDWQDLKESEGLVAASGRSQKQKQKRASHVLRTEAEHRSQGKKDEILTSSHDGLVLFSLCNLKMFHEFQIYEMHMILEISHAFHIHEI